MLKLLPLSLFFVFLGCGKWNPTEQEQQNVQSTQTLGKEKQDSGPASPLGHASSTIDPNNFVGPNPLFMGVWEQVDNRAVKIVLDELGRFETNLTFMYPVGQGFRISPVFPHRMSSDSADGPFTSVGFFNVVANNFENATLTADFYNDGKRLDISIVTTMSQNYEIMDAFEPSQSPLSFGSLECSCSDICRQFWRTKESENSCLEQWNSLSFRNCSCDCCGEDETSEPTPTIPEPPPSNDPGDIPEHDHTEEEECLQPRFFNPPLEKTYTFHFIKT